MRAAPAGLQAACASGAPCDVTARRRRVRSAAMADMADLFGSDADSEPEHKGEGGSSRSLSLSLFLPPFLRPGAPAAGCAARLASAAAPERGRQGWRNGGSGAEPRAGVRCLQGRLFCRSRVLETVEHLV